MSLLKVLLVDDDKFFLEDFFCPIISPLVARLMNVSHSIDLHSIDLHIAYNGLEGWDLYQKIDFDIVFTDYHMPLMNGKEFADKISTHHHQPKALFLVSSNPDSMIKGMTTFIEKVDIINFFVETKKKSMKIKKVI